MPFNPLSNFLCAWRYNRFFAAYVDDELGETTRERLTRHLALCERCRAAVEEQRFAASLVSLISAPEGAERPSPFRAGRIAARPASGRRRFLSPRLAGAVVMLAVAAFWGYNRIQSSTWQVVSLAGAPTINAQHIEQEGSLGRGELLETDPSSRARVQVGRIGYVDIDPNSRVRLASTKLTDQRLTLERGRLQATISAPPRIFFVDTPAAQAVDLGCAYTLEADESGKGLLQVTAGWVAFVISGLELKVPAGAACETRPEIGPGTPFFTDASAEFKEELKKLDFEKGGEKPAAETLERLLNEARPRDTLTLFYLLYRLGVDERPKVYDKLTSYSPPPDGVSREEVLKLERKTMDEYREMLEPTWLQESVPQLRRIWRWLWS